MTESKRILIIDFCNFEDYPIGGYLSFARNMMVSFGNEVALVGISTEKNEPIGRWFKKNIKGTVFDFFAYAYYSKSKTKHFIPDRLASFFFLRYYKNEIKAINIPNIFIRRQEVLMGIKGFGYSNICYCFAGLENPLSISKYWYAHSIANYFEKKFFTRLSTAQEILASGDEDAINEMLVRSKGLITRELVTKFPSRIDTEIFKPLDKLEVRSKLNIPEKKSIIVTTGRLGWLKGWKFMIDSFCIYEMQNPGCQLYFVGEGEDRQKIEDYILNTGNAGKIILVGKKNPVDVALYLNAANLFIMGSYKEGWSTSLIEAIACGVPVCVTNFSSAKEIISEGRNGYVIDDHDPDLFAKSMANAVKLPQPVYNANVQAYATNRLKEDLLGVWQLI